MQKIILIGFGFMGTMHAQIYAKLKQARIVAVVDVRRKPVQESMQHLGLSVPLFADIGKALAEVDADVVDICLPTDCHLENALTAIRAGKHLFCEKPITLTIADGRRIAEAAAKAGVTAQVGHCIRFWPEYRAFKKFVDSGKAGALLSLNLQRRSSLPSHSIADWLLDSKRSGGAALDFHVHDTDFVLHLLGKPRAVRSISPDKEAGSTQIFTQYLYENVSVAADCSWANPPHWGFKMAFQAVFENGAVEYDSALSPSLTVTIGKGQKRALAFKKPSVGTSSTGAGNISDLGGYFNELQSFIRALEAGNPPETATLDDAVDSLEVVLAEIKSARDGRQIPINS